MPNAATFAHPVPGKLLEKYFRIGDVDADERRRFMALARDLLNSDHAGHRLTFQLFAQSPAFSHLLAVYNNYDFAGPVELVRRYIDSDEPANQLA
jgi:4-hydroxyphenylacetate 3-monooxygenase